MDTTISNYSPLNSSPFSCLTHSFIQPKCRTWVSSFWPFPSPYHLPNPFFWSVIKFSSVDLSSLLLFFLNWFLLVLLPLPSPSSSLSRFIAIVSLPASHSHWVTCLQSFPWQASLVFYFYANTLAMLNYSHVPQTPVWFLYPIPLNLFFLLSWNIIPTKFYLSDLYSYFETQFKHPDWDWGPKQSGSFSSLSPLFNLYILISYMATICVPVFPFRM